MKSRKQATRQLVEQLPTARVRKRTVTQIAQEVLARKRLQREREIALLNADVRKVDIERTLRMRGVVVSHTTVSSVLAGTFRNDDVEKIFCELTSTKRDDMFPAAVPSAAD